MNLFVYGTLRHYPLLSAVAGESLTPQDCVLHDYAVRGLPHDIVPTIFAKSGATAKGMLVEDLSVQACARLDLFEGAWGYRRTAVTVETQSGSVAAEVYLPPDDQVAGTQPWSLATWVQLNGEAMVLAAQEVFARDSLPTQAALRVILPMAEKRAWARIRAKARKPPAQVRADHDINNESGMVEFHSAPVRGGFFGLQAQKVTHRRFDGDTNADLPREVFLGIDASLVLPYDPVTDMVLLVEQMRMGPLVLGEANPWVLEPVAGMIDARETPEEAGLREAQEEAELADLTLEKMFSFYASPGSSTDYFCCFLGLSSLGHARSYLGGLDAEHEDLRLHILPYEDAMALAQSGEINAGPLLAMLYWLAANRARLRP